MPEFLSLPNELVLEITENLPLHDISALVKTNHRLSDLSTGTLLTELFHSRSLTHGRRLLFQLASQQDLARVKDLLARGILSFTEPETLLHEVVKSQSVQALQTLLDSGLNPDEYDSERRTPLSLAAELGRVDCVRVLAARDDVDLDWSDDKHKTPLLLAVKGGQEEIVRILVQAAGDDPLCFAFSKTWQRCLHRAAREHLPILRFLLDHVDPNVWDTFGRTALHKAARAGNCLAVECLLADQRLNANTQDYTRRTAFHIAVIGQQAEIVKLLLSHPRVEINLSDHYGQTPLHAAVADGSTEIVHLLLSSPRVDVNLRDESPMGDTALHIAIGGGNLGIVKTFLEDSRVDINLPNILGTSPLGLAVELSRSPIIELLLLHPPVNFVLGRIDVDIAFDIADPAWRTKRMRLLAFVKAMRSTAGEAGNGWRGD